jgi:sulfoquinovosidase
MKKSSFDLCASDPTVFKVMISSPNIRYELFWGDDPADNINMLLDRTGRPPAPPIWNNGVWITCLGGENTVLEKARFLRKEHVPCSALWVYDAHVPQGNIGWPICPMHHSGIYHDVPGMVKQLHEMGFKVQTYLFPYFYVDSILYPEADQNGYFLKKADGTTYQMPFFRAVGRETIKVTASILDFTNPDAKSWWQNLIRYVVTDLGFDGWMHDFGEKIPEEVVAYNGLTGAELHNLYPVLYQQAAREVCNEYKPDASFYARSGFTGSQAWITASWPGDQICTWEADEGLASVLTACLSLSLCGVFYIGPDIGGYFGRGIQQESNNYSKELWIRWTQLGAFSSIMRDHLGDKPDGSIELWTDKETLQIFKKYAWLHMALSPYIQGCAFHSMNSGDPIMRHMFLVEPSNPTFWNCDDQYMFGDALLVAPILEDGVRSRSVVLPEGNWINYWNGEYYMGSKEVLLPAPLDQIPLLVKEATVLPMLLDHADTLIQSTDNSVTVATEDLKLMVFIPADWKNRTGDKCVSYRVLADGTKLENVWSNNSLHINISGTKKRTYLIEIPSSSIPKTCKLNSRLVNILESSEILEDTCIYDPNLQKLHIRCTDIDLKIELNS